MSRRYILAVVVLVAFAAFGMWLGNYVARDCGAQGDERVP